MATALARFAIMDDFAAAPRPDFAFSSLLGPAAAARLAAIGADAGRARGRAAVRPRPGGDARGRSLDRARARARRRRLLAGRSAGGRWPTSMRASPPRARPSWSRRRPRPRASPRVEPRFGAEITPDYFPMEVGLDAAIDYAKGCYLGQEPIVRIRDRGHINWRLVGLDVAGADDRRRADRDRERRQAEGRPRDQRRPPSRRPRRRARDASHQRPRRRDRPHPPRRRAHRRARPRRSCRAEAPR